VEALRVRALAEALRKAVGSVFVGSSRVLDLLLVAVLGEGHLLLEDVPGLGKTTLARALAQALGCRFQRLQCTPDLLPTDITGVSIYQPSEGRFEFKPGPVFAEILLVDEINRATPRTQAALLEAMQERQVTVDGVTYPLPRPFLVLATQNPVELEGTFPLPEAQLDRFMLRLSVGYPEEEGERTILRRFRGDDPLARLGPVTSAGEILELARACREVQVHPDVEGYALGLARATRERPEVELGASPRAVLALVRGAQVLAALNGRGYVLPDDVKALAVPTLAHRLLLTSGARVRRWTGTRVVEAVVAETPVPVEGVFSHPVPGGTG